MSPAPSERQGGGEPEGDAPRGRLDQEGEEGRRESRRRRREPSAESRAPPRRGSGPRVSAVAVKESPFHDCESAPAGEEGREEERERRGGQRRADRERRPRDAKASLRSGTIRVPTRSDQRPDDDPQGGSHQLHQCEDACGRRGREAALAVEEEDGEGQDADLRDDDQPAADRDRATCRASRSGFDDVSELRGFLGRRLAQADRARQRGREAGAGKDEQSCLRSPDRCDRRQRRAPRRRRRAGAPSAGSRARSPRCEGSNQPMTARPLAAFTLAPAPPARTSRSDERARSWS